MRQQHFMIFPGSFIGQINFCFETTPQYRAASSTRLNFFYFVDVLTSSLRACTMFPIKANATLPFFFSYSSIREWSKGCWFDRGKWDMCLSHYDYGDDLKPSNLYPRLIVIILLAFTMYFTETIFCLSQEWQQTTLQCVISARQYHPQRLHTLSVLS